MGVLPADYKDLPPKLPPRSPPPSLPLLPVHVTLCPIVLNHRRRNFISIYFATFPNSISALTNISAADTCNLNLLSGGKCESGIIVPCGDTWCADLLTRPHQNYSCCTENPDPSRHPHHYRNQGTTIFTPSHQDFLFIARFLPPLSAPTAGRRGGSIPANHLGSKTEYLAFSYFALTPS